MSLNPTDEQSAIIHWQGEKLVVNAFAGTGKTSTLVQFAAACPESRMLYLAYNRAIRDEAERRFPFNVENLPSAGVFAVRKAFPASSGAGAVSDGCSEKTEHPLLDACPCCHDRAESVHLFGGRGARNAAYAASRRDEGHVATGCAACRADPLA